MRKLPQIYLVTIALLAFESSVCAQQPYRNKASSPASVSNVTKSIPAPHPTMQHYSGGGQASNSRAPITYAPGYARPRGAGKANYTWRKNIVTTVFWVGEKPTPRNPRSNVKSSWDTKWMTNFGGYDNPDKNHRTYDFCPKGFRPRQNPFYCALPYNDVAAWNKTKSEARHMIPWFSTHFKKHGKTVLKGRWIAIHHNGKTCFAQWEDVGPFRTDDWSYVFGSSRPINQNNNGAGLDVSPAVRDYLGLRSGGKCHWRFVDLHEVRPGPWKKYGDNNHFVVPQERERALEQAELERLKRLRDAHLQGRR